MAARVDLDAAGTEKGIPSLEEATMQYRYAPGYELLLIVLRTLDATLHPKFTMTPMSAQIQVHGWIQVLKGREAAWLLWRAVRHRLLTQQGDHWLECTPHVAQQVCH